MVLARALTLASVVACLAGCSTPPQGSVDEPNAIFIIPGVGGDGGVYTHLAHTLADNDPDAYVLVTDWGSSWPVFLISISSTSWHQNAEARLAKRIIEWESTHQDGHLALIAHSAGAGVAAGALAQLPPGMTVGPIIFLAPDLSPRFNLGPMLAHTTVLHVFSSPRDDFFQGLGPTLVGTYDRKFTDGAGRCGFDLTATPASQRSKIAEHAYDPHWNTYGNEGGHYDSMADPFARRFLLPLLQPNGFPSH
jgi:pimeloyl-ACP methyl ester carboxylesterase